MHKPLDDLSYRVLTNGFVDNDLPALQVSIFSGKNDHLMEICSITTCELIDMEYVVTYACHIHHTWTYN